MNLIQLHLNREFEKIDISLVKCFRRICKMHHNYFISILSSVAKKTVHTAAPNIERNANVTELDYTSVEVNETKKSNTEIKTVTREYPIFFVCSVLIYSLWR